MNKRIATGTVNHCNRVAAQGVRFGIVIGNKYQVLERYRAFKRLTYFEDL